MKSIQVYKDHSNLYQYSWPGDLILESINLQFSAYVYNDVSQTIPNLAVLHATVFALSPNPLGGASISWSDEVIPDSHDLRHG